MDLSHNVITGFGLCAALPARHDGPDRGDCCHRPQARDPDARGRVPRGVPHRLHGGARLRLAGEGEGGRTGFGPLVLILAER